MSDPHATSALDDNAVDQPSVLDGMGVLKLPIRSAFKKAFGDTLDIDSSLELMQKLRSGSPVSDIEVVQAGVMYAHYLKAIENSPGEAEMLLLYLNQVKPTAYTPTLLPYDAAKRRIQIEHSELRKRPKFDTQVGINASVMVERAIQKRLDYPDSTHPTKAATFEKPDGTTETVIPAISPMKAGGTEAIYCEYNITIPGAETDPIKQALGTSTFFSKITVTSTPSDDGASWTVSIDAWENWGYDEGDFEWEESSAEPAEKKTQNTSVALESVIPKSLPYRQKVIKMIETNYPGLVEMLNDMNIKDKYMKQIENKVVTLPDGSVFNPTPYEIEITAWQLTTTEIGNVMFKKTYQLTPTAE